VALASLTALDFSRGCHFEALSRRPFSLNLWHVSHLYQSDKLNQTPNMGVFWKSNGVPLQQGVRNKLLAKKGAA